MKFEIKKKDFGGRIGNIRIDGWDVETPTIMPVINPNVQTIDPSKMEDFGAEILITNSYIIHKNHEIKDKALELGLQRLLGFDGPIMTDSGSYQLFLYGDVDISSKEILEFQKKIGSNISVPLDIPTSPDVEKSKAKDDLKKTKNRLEEASRIEGINIAGPIQGSTYLDLRKKSAVEASKIGFDLYCIGGVVPLMESYRFKELANITIESKKSLPTNAPIHLFGAGHPMTLPLAVALGCDIFDSAAYALFAKRERYMTSRGSKKLGNMKYLPCTCPICDSNSVEDLKNKELLASHNLYVTFKELDRIKEAIRCGELFELIAERCRAHPDLLAGFLDSLSHTEWFESLTPRTKKSAFFYVGEESIKRPEIIRSYEALKRFNLSGEILFITDQINSSNFPLNKSLNSDEIQKIIVDPPFVYPEELSMTYPFGQSMIYRKTKEARKHSKKCLDKILSMYKNDFEKIVFNTEIIDKKDF